MLSLLVTIVVVEEDTVAGEGVGVGFLDAKKSLVVSSDFRIFFFLGLVRRWLFMFMVMQ